MRFRRAELLLGAYFIYVAGVALTRPIAPGARALIVALNAALIVAFVVCARARASTLLEHARDFLPLPLILLAYREMGWLALPHSSRAFEHSMVVWDRVLLDEWGLRALIEAPGVALPALLELAYLLVYAVPVLMVVGFYLAQARERIDDAYSLLLFGTLTAYALYPFFPSEPPRSVFPNADLPLMNVVRAWNLRIVNGYGIHTSVFPSGHAAAACAAALAVWRLLPERRWLGGGFSVLAALICVATVYGRYHYAADTLAGLVLAGLGGLLSLGWQSRPRPR